MWHAIYIKYARSNSVSGAGQEQFPSAGVGICVWIWAFPGVGVWDMAHFFWAWSSSQERKMRMCCHSCIGRNCHADVQQRHPSGHSPWTWKSEEVVHDGEVGTKDKFSSLFWPNTMILWFNSAVALFKIIFTTSSESNPATLTAKFCDTERLFCYAPYVSVLFCFDHGLERGWRIILCLYNTLPSWALVCA